MIRRYDVAFGKEIEHEHGPWVRHKDAARLEAEIGTYLDRLQEAHEEIAVLREALLIAEYVLGQIDADDEIEAALRKVCDALAPARVRAGLIREAAKVGR